MCLKFSLIVLFLQSAHEDPIRTVPPVLKRHPKTRLCTECISAPPNCVLLPAGSLTPTACVFTYGAKHRWRLLLSPLRRRRCRWATRIALPRRLPADIAIVAVCVAPPSLYSGQSSRGRGGKGGGGRGLLNLSHCLAAQQVMAVSCSSEPHKKEVRLGRSSVKKKKKTLLEADKLVFVRGYRRCVTCGSPSHRRGIHLASGDGASCRARVLRSQNNH